MAQYKVLQNIEAEDKLLGPLSLRQFIYAVVVVVLGFIAWRLLAVQWLLVLPFIPPIIFFAALAAPFGKDQSSEVWMLAKIRYFVVPRKRIWSQDGIQSLVNITVPKVDPKQVTKDFDKSEAKSRLKALADTMDTRGWAIKNVSTNGYISPAQQSGGGSDRLLDLQTSPQEDLVSVKPSEDVLDANNTPLAQSLGSMQAQSEQAHRQAILQKMQSLAAEQKSAQEHLPTLPAPQAQTAQVQAIPPQPQPTVTLATPTAPVSAQPAAVQPVQQPVTPPPAPAIINEVESPPAPKNELDVGGSDDEVVVSLH